MAQKNVNVSRKRKPAASADPERRGPFKKAKVGSLRRPFDQEERSSDSDRNDDFANFSADEDEDGGAAVEKEKSWKKSGANGNDDAKKSFRKGDAEENRAPKAKVFEKGKSNFPVPMCQSVLTVPGDNSRESHIKQKQLAQERKAAKPLADELQRLKKLWEKLRRKSHVPKEERKLLIEELFSIVTGRVKDFVLKHDAVRAVQTAVKYSTAAQRREIASELKGTYAHLAENRYAKFLIGKLLETGDKEIRDLIIPEFYGKVRRLLNHPEGSWIVDDIYRSVATPEQKANMLREWYGPEFLLFRTQEDEAPTADLSVILANEPGKRATVLKYLIDMVNQLIQKQMTGFTMLHDAMLQYYLNLAADSEEAREFLEIVKGDEAGDLLRNMAFTKSGARLSCLLLAHGTAKDRKQLLRAYKDTIRLMMGDKNGHMVILAAYDLIDDTVLSAKAIFPEVFGKDPAADGHIVFVANDSNARTTILYLLDGVSKSLFPASRQTDREILEEIHQIRKTTSKKDNEVRRKELIAAMSPALLTAVAGNAANLVSSAPGSLFVSEILLGTVGDKSAALSAVAATAAGDPNAPPPEGVYPPPPPHISQSPHGGKLFRSLVAGGLFDKETGQIQRVEPPLLFADIFYEVVQEHVVGWATGPSSFAVVMLLNSPDFTHKEELLRVLRKHKAELKSASVEAISKHVRKDGEEARKPKGKGKKLAATGKGETGARRGNAGAQQLLELL
jgi:pumilio homology domain family member 6